MHIFIYTVYVCKYTHMFATIHIYIFVYMYVPCLLFNFKNMSSFIKYELLEGGDFV